MSFCLELCFFIEYKVFIFVKRIFSVKASDSIVLNILPPLVRASKSTDLIDGILDKAAKNNLLLDQWPLDNLHQLVLKMKI